MNRYTHAQKNKATPIHSTLRAIHSRTEPYTANCESAIGFREVSSIPPEQMPAKRALVP